MKIINVVGARPNFMKIMPILREMKRHRRIKSVLLHTGQHYDFNMSEIFFQDLKIPRPDIYLDVGSGTHGAQTACIMERFEKVLIQQRPDLVLVVGDVNSTLACSLAAKKMGIRVAHVEAGLRSYDQRMPEEINRVLTDQLADFLFTTSASDNSNLMREGIARDKIFLVGNTMADTLLGHLKSLRKGNKGPAQNGKGGYAVVTIHRAENVDDRARLEKIGRILQSVAAQTLVYFPVHPRTQRQIKEFKLQKYFERGIERLAPQSYSAFVNLCAGAKFVMTDSGGLQTESTLLNVPCLTMRENTEWTITLKKGTNTLVGLNETRIRKAVQAVFAGRGKQRQNIPLWDGKASQRIVKILLRKT